MKVRFWGVRGSIPVPGPQTNRYGGNTSCVQLSAPGCPPIIIDAGTGIRRLGKALAQEEFREGKGVAHLLISHTHWDHIQGLPFFSPLYTRGNHLHVYALRRDTHLRAVFASQTEGPYFPVSLDALRAEVSFHELGDHQALDIGPARVRCARLNHPWIALAYRVDVGGRSVVYASDTAPFTDILFEHEFIAQPPPPGAPLDPGKAAALRVMRAALVDLCRGADLLIYDTQFTPEEYRQKPHWGHSTPDDAIAIAREAEVRTLALYHHAPHRSDDEQDAILATYRDAVRGQPLELIAAREGLEVDLGEDGRGMKVRFWGVRGMIPAPGPETNRYGGNTSCVSVEGDDGTLVILDMGTGVMRLGHHLMTGAMGRGQGRAAVLLTHAHWDHIQGFPFFPPVFVPGNNLHIFGNADSSDCLEAILEGQMNPHFSPISTLKNLGARIAFTAVSPDVEHQVGGLQVTAYPNPHGRTSALAFRIQEGGKALVYAADAGYAAGRPSAGALSLYRSADVLIHDATYTPADRAARLDRGNSSYAEAAAAAVAAEVRHLVLFHYDQDYSDEAVDDVVRACRDELDRLGGQPIALTAAAEGLELEL